MPPPPFSRDVASTGIPGLDHIMDGGFTRRRLFLIEGVPGSGKTSLALQFLITAAARGERALYVSLSETDDELRDIAASHGWDLGGIDVRELTPPESDLDPDEQDTMFFPNEVELAATMQRVLADVERIQARCVVIDSLSELRLMAGTALRYRRQILALKQFFSKRDCTLLVLDDMTASDHDLQLHSIAHGVVLLEQLAPEYGGERRRLRVVKYRGAQFRGGYHDYVIRRGGIVAFPRLVAAEHREERRRTQLPSGIAQLDALMGGGLEEGTSTLIVGAAGTGKSTIAAQFAASAALRGQRAALFVFDENPVTLLDRCEQLGVPLREAVDQGAATIRQVDPAELAPGEFTQHICEAVEASGARVVVIDSLNGYLNAMPEERFLTIQLHELLMYLSQKSVVTILIGAHQGLVGGTMKTPVDASYLADAVLLLRYFEDRGEVRQAISVIKKRGSRHERTVRAFKFGPDGITVGEPLRDLRGVLTGVPVPDEFGRGESTAT